MFKKRKKSLCKLKGKLEKACKITTFSLIGMILFTSKIYAQPQLITGTNRLFSAITTWLVALIPAGAGAVLGYHALQKALSDDQAVIAEKNKQMRNVIIGAAIAESAAGLVHIITQFY